MRDEANVEGVRLNLAADFEPGRLSAREREVLRTILPRLMLELIQESPQDEDEE